MPVLLIMRAASATPSSVPSKPGAIIAASTEKVAITFSFAMSPVIAATANTQPYSMPSCEPKPSGVKTG